MITPATPTAPLAENSHNILARYGNVVTTHKSKNHSQVITGWIPASVFFYSSISSRRVGVTRVK